MKIKAFIAMLLIAATLALSCAALADSSDKFDLSNFGYRSVSSKGRGSLVFQSRPYGSFMRSHKFYDGDQIYVNLSFRQKGYAIAYENGEYGYVDASYIDWGYDRTSAPAPRPEPDSDDKYDLDQYEYRRVDSNGRGSLVFQRAPRGKSMKGHKFYDGDWIYVNVRYRKSGYTMAYENGEYGYVDASYIDW